MRIRNCQFVILQLCVGDLKLQITNQQLQIAL